MNRRIFLKTLGISVSLPIAAQEGMRNPYPHSCFVGLIPGGILNGIAGNVQDEPVLDMEYGFDWRTCEYWAPHNAWYLWAVSKMGRI